MLCPMGLVIFPQPHPLAAALTHNKPSAGHAPEWYWPFSEPLYCLVGAVLDPMSPNTPP